MQTVLISCIPKLNATQQKGLANLINDFEALGLKVYLWGDNDFDTLDAYDVKRITAQSRHKYKRYWYQIKARLSLDSKKWLQRITRWTGNEDAANAKKLFANYIKEFAKVFAATDPAYFFCWNPYCCRFGVAYDAAKILGFKTLAIEWGYLPDTFILDSGGTLASSIIFNKPLANYSEEKMQAFAEKGKITFEELKSISLSLYQQAKVEIPADFLLRDDKTVRVLVLAIDEIDSGAYPADDPERKGLLPFHVSSYQQALDIAAVNKNYRVIFKPHPSHNLYKENIRINPNTAIVNGNPDELIDWADVVFCSGSKMEFSVILKNKPLITYGAGLLYGKNCSYELSSPANTTAVVEKALSKIDNDSHMQNFLAFLGYLNMEYLYSFVNNKNKVVEHVLKEDNL